MNARRAVSFIFLPVCMAATAWFLARSTFYLREEVPAAPVPSSAAAAPSRPAARLEPPSLEPILRRNLFQAALEPPAGRRDEPGGSGRPGDGEAFAENPESVPVSGLGWKLLGTVVDRAERGRSRAVLLIDGKQAAYGEQAEIKGWKVAFIARRLVLLDRNGRKERLQLEGAGLPRPRAERPPDLRKTLDRQALRRAASEPGELLRAFSVVPQTAGNRRGLRIVTLEPDSCLAGLGLLRDDLLLTANGKALKDFEDLAGIAGLLREGKIRLEVLRNGKKLVMDYELQG